MKQAIQQKLNNAELLIWLIKRGIKPILLSAHFSHDGGNKKTQLMPRLARDSAATWRIRLK